MSENEGFLGRFPALRQLTPGSRGRRRIPYIQQTTSTECGAVCLAMILAFHGKRMRLDEIRDLIGVGRDGADALSILEGGHLLGLRGRGVQIDEIENLEYLSPASVLHWQFNHFVIFERLTRDGAVIVDPAAGRRTVPLQELRKAFTGIALTFEPSEEFETGGERATGVGRYVRQILTQSGLLTRILVTSLLVQILALALPLCTGLLVDRVVPREDYHLLFVLSIGLVMIVGFSFLAGLIRAHLMLHLRTQLDAKITLEFLEHLIDLPYAFFQRRSSGDLMMRLNSNTTIRETLTSTALTGVLDGGLATFYLILLFVAHFQLGLLVLVLALLRVGLFLLSRRRYADLMSEALQTQAQSRNYQVQMLAGIETLKAMGAERRSVEQWSNLFVDELNVSLARGRLSALVDTLLAGLGTASPLIILVYGGTLVLDGTLTLGSMLAISALATGFLTPITSLVSTAIQLQLMGSYVERINDVMETPKEQQRGEVTQAAPLQGRIALDHVSFSYSAGSPTVVNDVSLDIEPGAFVALVGASGAGKSTLAKLLLGLYQPTSGRIYFDGVELNTLDLRSVRSQLGIVTQQPYLFGTSVRANIALTDPGLAMPKIVRAAKLAHIHDDIMAMPMAYDTMVADGGASLSGGQRQRIALARALVQHPAILLLDEATSNLDSVTERDIQEELAALRCTRIVIAHRLSTIMAADVILVMNQGQVIERGTHSELMGRPGFYRQLIAAQVQEEEAS
ncbi:MAG: peptidase domain-containing ABC transporter [Acidobacteriota bacterium]